VAHLLAQALLRLEEHFAPLLEQQGGTRSRQAVRQVPRRELLLAEGLFYTRSNMLRRSSRFCSQSFRRRRGCRRTSRPRRLRQCVAFTARRCELTAGGDPPAADTNWLLETTPSVIISAAALGVAARASATKSLIVKSISFRPRKRPAGQSQKWPGDGFFIEGPKIFRGCRHAGDQDEIQVRSGRSPVGLGRECSSGRVICRLNSLRSGWRRRFRGGGPVALNAAGSEGSVRGRGSRALDDVHTSR